MKEEADRTVVVIAGPTGAGKTSLGMELAQRLGGEIISVDSRQIYRYMDIGTAKPTIAELSLIRHHFVDLRNPDEVYNAGAFGRDARESIRSLWERGTIPVLVGGSGLYFQAILDGFFVDTQDRSEARSQLEQKLDARGLEFLYAELAKLDPLAHARINPSDSPRILRALELARDGGAGQEVRWQEHSEKALECLPVAFCITHPRDRLYQRIDDRVDRMIADGLVDEVRHLNEMGYSSEAVGMQTFGYAEIGQILDGALSRTSAVEAIKVKSRQYAKRQLTWFRRDRRFRWLDIDDLGQAGALKRIQTQLDARMGRYVPSLQ